MLDGDVLASVEPSYGVGVEIGKAMVNKASQKHPDLRFVQSDPESLELREKFDCIIFNHVFDTVDVLGAFERMREHCEDRRSIRHHQLQRAVAANRRTWPSKIGLRSRFVEPNWVSADDIRGFLNLAGFRSVRQHRLLLFPKWIPFLSFFMNEFIARLPGLRRLCLMQVVVARPFSAGRGPKRYQCR